MRIAVYPADQGGCGHYRLIWPAEANAIVPQPEGPIGDGIWHEDDAGNLEIVDGPVPDADVIVMQRPLRREKLALIGWFQRNGIAVVIDVDDDFAALHPRNIAWQDCHPKHSPDSNYLWLRKACGAADLVTVSTPALAQRYGSHGRVRVLPNCVPAWYLDVERDDHDGIYVGWSGTIQTHPDDLQTTRGAVARAVEQEGAHLAAIGTGIGVRDALDYSHDVTASGWLELDDYPHALGQLDVGIVPLADTAFNAAKSWLKGLEMAAVGVPFVASPTPEYERLATLGAGVLAGRTRTWRTEVARLCRSSGYREEVAGRGRETAARWTIEEHAPKWREAWESAAEHRAAA